MDERAGIELPANNEARNQVHRFLGVVPIAQVGMNDLLVIVLSALERYTSHARLTVTLYMSNDHPETRRRNQSTPPKWPDAVMSISDDVGSYYRIYPRGGGGSDSTYQLDYTVTPGIPTDAHSLTITIAEVIWSEIRPDRQLPDQQIDVTPGPWAFTAHLSRQLDAQLIARAGESA